MTPREVLALIREKDVKAVDLRFMDFPGLWKHLTVPAEMLTDERFEDGFGFDGSGLRGWQKINEADMLLVPQPDTHFLDPFAREPTLAILCNIQDPNTREDYTRDPRNVARKAVHYMHQTGFADAAQFGPSLEFFVFDEVKYDQTPRSAFYFLDSGEGHWNTGREERPNLGYKIPARQGYFPCPPGDQLYDLRTEMMLAMGQCGLQVESHHHEKASGGQCLIDIRHADLLTMADGVLKYKYVVKNVARRHGKTATFMPKPLFDDYGSGMHVHTSLWKGGHEPVRRQRVLRAERRRPVRHRRHPQTRPGAVRHHQPDHQQLQAAGAGLRSPHHAGVQPAEPVGGHPHPGVLGAAARQADRIPPAGRGGQPVPRVRGDAHGHARRAAGTRPTPASRWTRTSTTCRRRS